LSFDGGRIRLVRQFRGLSMTVLGNRIGLTDSAIHAYETGAREPKDLGVEALAAALGVQPNFFFIETSEVNSKAQPYGNFRALASATDKLRSRVQAHTALLRQMICLLREVVRFPPLNVPKIEADTAEEIERAAEKCRDMWGLGPDSPVTSPTRLAELNGILVAEIRLPLEREIRGFSSYGIDGLILLNSSILSESMSRLTVLHEIAHGVLPHDADAISHEVKEGQGFHLAGALALPRSAFSREFMALGGSKSWQALFEMKGRWMVSVQAIVHRAYQLKLIDAAEYQRRFKYMARSGWRRGPEPFEPPRDPPEFFRAALARYLGETGVTTRVIADRLGWSYELFSEITGVEHAPFAADPQVASLAEYQSRKTKPLRR
jgi:Zn-dependent peptidase ImmA (M78 family)